MLEVSHLHDVFTFNQLVVVAQLVALARVHLDILEVVQQPAWHVTLYNPDQYAYHQDVHGVVAHVRKFTTNYKKILVINICQLKVHQPRRHNVTEPQATPGLKDIHVMTVLVLRDTAVRTGVVVAPHLVLAVAPHLVLAVVLDLVLAVALDLAPVTFT
jgi:hypothetical protein